MPSQCRQGFTLPALSASSPLCMYGAGRFLVDLLYLMPCPCLRSAAWLPLQGELAALREAAEQARATAARQHERLLAAEMSITSLKVGCLATFPGAISSSSATMASIGTTSLCFL